MGGGGGGGGSLGEGKIGSRMVVQAQRPGIEALTDPPNEQPWTDQVEEDKMRKNR